MYCDPSLLELFHAEAEAHMAVLTDGLLALERDPRQSGRYEELMRAAHSIKGAARIVGLDHAVALAHVIEDCFVAARDGKLAIRSETVDVLLPAVDMLQRVTQAGETANVPAEVEIQAVVQRVREAMAGGAPSRPQPAGATPVRAHRVTPSVFRPSGALDSTWVAAHRDSLSACLQERAAEIHFDLSATTSVDPTGAALLVILGREAARHQPPTALRVIASCPAIDQLFAATALDRLYVLMVSGG